MDVLRVFAVVALVLFAGCFGVLGGGGGGGTDTPGATADGGPIFDPAGNGTAETGTASPTPTASPSNESTRTATATPTATPTPLPDSFERTTLENGTLGISAELVGEPDAVDSGRTGDVTGAYLTRGGVLNCARASPFVGVVTNGTVADATVTMDYDPAMLPEGADESELAVFAFNRTLQFYLEMDGRVDVENDTVVGTGLDPTRSTFTNDETNETINVALDGTRLDNAFVVMHKPTYREGVNTGEVPAHCTDGEESGE